MSRSTIQITPELNDYCIAHALREEAILSQLRAETESMIGGNMQIAPEQGQFMALLVKMISAERTLDIGCFTGYSALAVAYALPKKGQVLSFDINVESSKVALRYWQAAGMAHKIQLHLGPAKEQLERLLAEGQQNSFQFAFIDADKRSVDAYYELALQLLMVGGVIAVDNCLWDGKVADDQNQEASTLALRALNDKVHHDNRVDTSLLPIGDGLLLARKR